MGPQPPSLLYPFYVSVATKALKYRKNQPRLRCTDWKMRCRGSSSHCTGAKGPRKVSGGAQARTKVSGHATSSAFWTSCREKGASLPGRGWAALPLPSLASPLSL